MPYIYIGNKKISYTVKKSKKARNIRLSVYKDNEIRVTVPYRYNIDNIDQLLLNKSDWILKSISENSKNFIIEEAAEFSVLKNEYLKYITGRVIYLNSFYNFNYQKITLRKSKTRWGSCSINGNLNFNYKIYYLPQKFSDYIIIHELCHLKEFNHSSNFWALVKGRIPEYKEIKKELKRYSL